MTDPEYFTAMYDRGEDPFGFDVHWYEERKRVLTAAALPRARYRLALELGSSIGNLTAHLIDRCDQIVCVELDHRAAETARRRLASSRADVTVIADDLRSVLLDHSSVVGEPDVVVVSEVLYYFSAGDLAAILERLDRERRRGATVVAVHWRHPVAEHHHSGDVVHRRLAEAFGPPAVEYRDTDFLLDVFQPPGQRSTAAEDGLAP